MLKRIDFLPDLEAGIRAAWRHDRAVSPVRLDLISLGVGISPFAKDHGSFISLLDEVPGFAVQYVKALLGCPEMQRVESHGTLATNCQRCQNQIFDYDGSNIGGDAFVWTPTSLNFWDNYPGWFCSRVCYNAEIHETILCEDP